MFARRKAAVIAAGIACVGWTEEQAGRIAEAFFMSSSSKLPAHWAGRSSAERSQAIREFGAPRQALRADAGVRETLRRLD
jgi:hypothetical protein